MRKLSAMILAVIGLSLILSMPMRADDATTPPATEQTGNRAEKAPKTLAPAVVSCVQTALETRDTAIVAAVDKYATSGKAALTARKDALKAAWAIPTAKEMKAALKTAWANYKTALKDARKILKTDKKTAWDKFKTDRKTCKAPNQVDSSNEGMDSQL